MRDPDRLLSHGATAAEFALLEAARVEEPPAHGPERLRVALGLSTLAVITAASASTASAVAPAVVAASVPKLSAVKLLAWLLVAGGALGVGTVVLVTPPRAAPVEVRRTPVAVKVAPSAPSPVLEAPVPVVEKPHEPAAPRMLRSIGAETTRLDRARTALQRGDAQQALDVLERYQRAHPRGVLRQEAEVLRIEALLGAGELRTARRRAARFLRSNPHSPHAERVRQLVSSESHGP